MPKRHYLFLLITRASRSLPARSAESEAERLSEACFERGFRPTCEVKTGTFDPRTTFCRSGASRSPLTNERPCSGLLPKENCYKQSSVHQF